MFFGQTSTLEGVGQSLDSTQLRARLADHYADAVVNGRTLLEQLEAVRKLRQAAALPDGGQQIISTEGNGVKVAFADPNSGITADAEHTAHFEITQAVTGAIAALSVDATAAEIYQEADYRLTGATSVQPNFGAMVR